MYRRHAARSRIALVLLATALPTVASPLTARTTTAPTTTAVDLALGGDDCVSALDLTGTLTCDGTWLVDAPIGMATATGSGNPPGACWFTGDLVDADRWYTWANTTGGPVEFAVSTNLHVSDGADSQIAVYDSCLLGTLHGCAEDISDAQFLSSTGVFPVPAGDSIVIQFDGFLADRSFEAGLFYCIPEATIFGDNCAGAIDLGTLTPSASAPAVVRQNELEPRGVSDYSPREPTFGRFLTAAEACYQFTASDDGWVQIAAANVNNDTRIIFSDNGGASFAVAPQCYNSATGGYGAAGQHGTEVSAGRDYCFCVDAGPASVVNPGDFFDLEMHYWRASGQTNVDCASAEVLDFCTTLSIAKSGLSTAATGHAPGVDPGAGGCGPWAVCSGLGNDLHYTLTWTQGMVDCGCNGFTVTQTSPVFGVDSRVCDAAIQIHDACPGDNLTCVSTADASGPGATETATVSGIGAAQVGTSYYISLDQYMESACPNFASTFTLTGCTPGCPDLCTTCTPSAPTGAIANVLMAVKDVTDVDLSWVGATVTPPNHAVYATEDPAMLGETPAQIGSQTRIAVTSAPAHTDAGVVGTPPLFVLYKVLPADNCDETVYP